VGLRAKLVVLDGARRGATRGLRTKSWYCCDRRDGVGQCMVKGLRANSVVQDSVRLCWARLWAYGLTVTAGSVPATNDNTGSE
jgi:hypothetical protein